jgi:hypothetical protein
LHVELAQPVQSRERRCRRDEPGLEAVLLEHLAHRLGQQLARLDTIDRAYVVDLVRRHVVADEPLGA